MTKVSREEVLKIAEISHISLKEDEIEPMMKHLQGVLSYAERVQEVAADIEEPSDKNVNVFREDVVAQFQAEKVLCQTPEREENYFVVPAIIKSK